MDTLQAGTTAPRRRHSEAHKARWLAAWVEAGASVAAVAAVAALAQAHGLNAHLVHQWRRGCGAPMCNAARPVRSAVTVGAEFIAPALPASTVAATATTGQPTTAPVAVIRIEWRRVVAAIAVSWPVSAAPQCARCLLRCVGAK